MLLNRAKQKTLETFVDDGDFDLLLVLRMLRKNGFDGVLIPDHTPQMTCSAPWHAGMAYAMGFMRAAMRVVEESGTDAGWKTGATEHAGSSNARFPTGFSEKTSGN